VHCLDCCVFVAVSWKQDDANKRRIAQPPKTARDDLASMASSQLKDDKAVLPEHVDTNHSPTNDPDDIVSLQKGDLLDLESVDPVLNAKMKLVNDAIDEIGFTGYQAKLFVLNGFGYVVHFFALCAVGRSWRKAAAHTVA
jgi:hypothetical protein